MSAWKQLRLIKSYDDDDDGSVRHVDVVAVSLIRQSEAELLPQTMGHLTLMMIVVAIMQVMMMNCVVTTFV